VEWTGAQAAGTLFHPADRLWVEKKAPASSEAPLLL